MKKVFVWMTAMLLTAGVFIAGCGLDGSEDSTETQLTGTVADENGDGIGDAEVVFGDATALTNNTGAFTIENPELGGGALTVHARYFEQLEKQVEITEGTNTVDVTLATLPFKVTQADRSLAESYNADFDWTEDRLAVDIVTSPTRARIERAIYYHSPALYRDDSGEDMLTLAEPPSLTEGQAVGFDFSVDVDGTSIPAFDTVAVFDTADEAGLSEQTLDDYMAWDAVVEEFLLNWDFAAADPLYGVGNAVVSEKWGGTNILGPQLIEKLFLQDGALYVEIAFRSFMTLGEGITDSDSDGQAEVYAKVNPELYTEDLVNKLKDDYIGKTYTVLELREAMEHIRSALYSKTNPQIEAALGETYEAEGVGTFEYPAVVLSHANAAVNVLLIEP